MRENYDDKIDKRITLIHGIVDALKKGAKNKDELSEYAELLLNSIENDKIHFMSSIVSGIDNLYKCEPYIIIYNTSTTARCKTKPILTSSWECENNLVFYDFYANNSNDSIKYSNIRVFPLSADLYKSAVNLPENKTSYITCISQERIIYAKETHKFKNWKSFSLYEDAVKYLDEIDCEDKYLFALSDEITQDMADKYNRICAAYEFMTEKNCFDMLNEDKNKGHFKVHMEGDIIITDPCYIIRHRDESTRPKWEDYHKYSSLYEYPDYDKETGISNMFNDASEKLTKADEEWCKNNPDDKDSWDNRDLSPFGFTDYLTHDTLYGDWSCHTFNSDTKEVIGKFCADGGMVGVFLLDEVLKYNPDYNDVDNAPFAVTLIKDFKGDVWFERTDDILVVKGSGNINFKTAQTGF